MATTEDKSLNIDLIAFGDTAQLTDWLNEVAWSFPLLMLTPDPIEVLRVHAGRLGRLRSDALSNFDKCATALLNKSKAMSPELELMRSGMAAFNEAINIAHPKEKSVESDSNLRDALWEALETEALSLEPVRKALDKEVSTFLSELERGPTHKIEQAQTLLEEGLVEAPLERARMIREARKHLREAMSLDSVQLHPIFWAEIGWINWQASAGETESLEWFALILQDIEGLKGIGIGACARLRAYFLALAGQYTEAYKWSRIAADFWPCLGTFHERAQYAMSGATSDVAKQQVTAFIKKSPLATLLAFADPKISELGAELAEICVKRQIHLRQKAQVATGEWELASHKVTAVLKILPSIQIPYELIEGPTIAKAGLDHANFLVAAQTLLRSIDGKASLNRAVHGAIHNETRRRTETLMMARKTVEAIMQERDDLLKSSTDAHEEEVSAARLALLESDDNAKAQKGCGMGMGGGCAMLVLYMVAMMLAGKGVSLGPSSPMGMFCIAMCVVPLVISVIYYIGCMSKRMVLETKLSNQMDLAKKAYDSARNEANTKFRTKLESAKARVTQEEQLLQHAEAVAKQLTV